MGAIGLEGEGVDENLSVIGVDGSDDDVDGLDVDCFVIDGSGAIRDGG